MTAKINILKGIPRIFLIEQVKTTINKFEDILRCFNWFLSNMKKHFKIKATPIWQFTAFINDPLWKVARRQARLSAPPGKQVKGDIVNLKLSQTSFLRKWH